MKALGMMKGIVCDGGKRAEKKSGSEVQNQQA
jgi:hypothetical protein